MTDIYFSEAYGKLYETVQHGKLERFEYEDGNGKILHQFIRRPIDVDLGDGKNYFDLITPYGYGGPVVLNCFGEDRAALTEGFGRAFTDYCRQNHIVSEYITFHPVEKNAGDFEGLYHPVFTRKTLGTTLTWSNPVMEEFSGDTRRKTNKFMRKGVDYRIIRNPENLEQFIDIYYDTMDHNAASGFYYFDRAYFAQLLAAMSEDLVMVEALYENKVIAAEIGMLNPDGGTIHRHLAGTLSEFRSLSPQYVMCYGLTVWGKENGYTLIHSGGGLSPEEDDPLFQFKRKFSQKTEFELYTAKKIWNAEVYSRICDAKGIDKEKVLFFPAYRASV